VNSPFERIPRWLRLTPLQWTVVIGAALIVALMGFFFQSQKESTYSATAKILFRTAELDPGASVFSGSGEPERDAATNVKLVASNEVAVRVARAAGLPPSRAGDLLASLSVGSAGDSNIVDVTLGDSNPQRAAVLANAWAEQFRLSRIEADRAKVQEAIDFVENRVAELQANGASTDELTPLRIRLGDLQSQLALQTGNVEIFDRATVPSQVDQSSPKQVALGVGLLQFLLGLGLMAGYRRLRDPVDGAEDLQGLNLPVLAELPRVRRVPIARGARSAEGFDSGLRLLLGNLKFVASPGTGAAVVAIQSTRPSEGKSTIAFHLARVAARSGSSVCLIDADLRFRTITRGVGEPHGIGLSNLLSSLSAASPGEVGVRIDEALTSVEGFDLLAAGPAPPNPGDLAVRDVVPYIVETLRHRYDLVIIDAPPFLGLPDAARFLQAADSVVIVVRRRAARLYQVRRLIDRMKVLGAKPVGTVVNMAAPRDEDLAYGYPEPGQGIEEPIASEQAPGGGRARPARSSGDRSTTRIRRTIGRRLKKDDVPAPTARPATPPPAREAAPAEAPTTRPVPVEEPAEEPVEEPVATMAPSPTEAEAQPPSEPDTWAELREWTDGPSEGKAQGENPPAPEKPAARDRGGNGRRRTKRPSGEKPPTQSGR
jgi:capsular exopolysaccharide synthesis family protein